MNSEMPMQSVVGGLGCFYTCCNKEKILVPSGRPTIYCNGSHNKSFMKLTEEQERSMMPGSKILKIQIISILQAALNIKTGMYRNPRNGLEPEYASEVRRHIALMKADVDMDGGVFDIYLTGLIEYFYRLNG